MILDFVINQLKSGNGKFCSWKQRPFEARNAATSTISAQPFLGIAAETVVFVLEKLGSYIIDTWKVVHFCYIRRSSESDCRSKDTNNLDLW